MESVPLDGNAAAGPLGEMFAAEMTTAVTICATCRAASPVAELRAYMNSPGAVLRCNSCGAVQIRIVRAPGRAWLDLHGTRMIELEMPGETRATDRADPDSGSRSSRRQS